MTKISTMLLFLAVLALPGCGTVSNLSQALSDARVVAAQVKDTVDKVKPEIDRIAALAKEIGDLGEGLGGGVGEIAGRISEMGSEMGKVMTETMSEFKAIHAEQKALADRDGDGELDWKEWLLYALGIGGAGTVAARRGMKKIRDVVAEEAAVGAAQGAAAAREGSL